MRHGRLYVAIAMGLVFGSQTWPPPAAVPLRLQELPAQAGAKEMEAKLLELWRQRSPPDAVECSWVIHRWAAEQRPSEAYRLLCRMRQRLVAPDAVCFHCAMSGSGAEALALLEEMAFERLEPSARTLNVVLAACARSAELPRALETLEAMPRWRLRPDAVSYNTLLSCCAQVRDGRAASEILEAMPRRAV